MATNLERFVMVTTLALASGVAIGQLSTSGVPASFPDFDLFGTQEPQVSNRIRFIDEPLRRSPEVLVVKNGKRTRFDPTSGPIARGTQESPEMSQLSIYRSTSFRDSYERAYGASN